MAKKKAKVYVIANQKGGVTKTTTTAALGVALARKGEKVLLIDLEPQRNLTASFGVSDQERTVADILYKEATAEECITHLKDVDIIPGTPFLSGSDAKINETGKEYILSEAIESLKAVYTYIFIDTPPSMDILTINGLVAADKLIIPITASQYAIQGMHDLATNLQPIKKYFNKSLTIDGILFTLYDKRTILTRDLTEDVEEMVKGFNTKVYCTKIRKSTAMEEAARMQQTIFDYSPRCNAARDYIELADEIKRGATK